MTFGPLVFSIRPKYVRKLLDGSKSVEYRTRRPNLEPGDTILIYETGPKSMVVASAVVHGICEGSPAEVWERTTLLGGIDRSEYDRYFAGRDRAYGIDVTVTALAEPVRLPEGMRAPQSWAYWRGAWPPE